MKIPQPLNERLPVCELEKPAEAWIHTTPVTGHYGITAAVDSFADVLDWQEHHRSLTRGYYRLIHPPQVQDFKFRLERKYPGWTAVLFCSGKLAQKELGDLLTLKQLDLPHHTAVSLPDHLEKKTAHILCLDEGGIEAGVVLLEDPDLAAELHERNRRRGGSLSARNVDVLLHGCENGMLDSGAATSCTERLCRWEKAETAFFFPSGMAAVTAVLEGAVQGEHPYLVVLGNVYRDTHLLLEEHRWAGRDLQTDFLDTHDLNGLQSVLRTKKADAVLIETITNPLIEIPDLPRIAEYCHKAGVPLLVDSTMAGPLNACPIELGATVVIHSTSKYLSGSNTHGGGAVLVRNSEWREKIGQYQEKTGACLSPLEFPVLARGLADYPDRLKRFNDNGRALAELLRSHPAVEQVYFANDGQPDWLKGLGSVVSCELKSPSLEKVKRFYGSDLPGILKAPSLGSNHTLFCPYVLLAYYEKSDEYLKACNLSKTLLRFAAGCEKEFSGVLQGIKNALDSI